MRVTPLHLLFLILSMICSGFVLAQSKEEEKENLHERETKFESAKFALEHVMDSHEWHIADYKEHPISIPLPIILWDSGLIMFMSSSFEHGHKVVEQEGNYYKLHNNKIYKTDAFGTLDVVKSNEHPTNELPLDFSITKNTASMMLAALFMFLIFFASARSYREGNIPKGIARFLEPLVVFVRDEIAIPNVGEKKARFFLPYLLTVFFFIWINNLFGLLPIPPGGGANVTGNIAVTMVLAIFTLIITNVFANKYYWLHIFNPLGNSFPTVGKAMLYIILVPVEIIGIITKPFALMVRLFANITAGHIIIISLTALIFMFKTSFVAIATVPFTLFMNCIELLVALLQAYIFTLLSALFIGLAVKDHEEAH